MDAGPPYIDLQASGELERRAERLEKRLEDCDICPRLCGVNRIRGERGYCHSLEKPVVASYCDHHGEEPVLSGSHGSGTIFLANCNLRCVYCQNYQISQDWQGQEANTVTVEALAGYMLELQNRGCHNLNLVSPGHFVPQIVRALVLAVPLGLRLPVVYNTNSYDSLETLAELEGVVSIYLPDLKYADDQQAKKYSRAADYTLHARQAIREMYRQAGELKLDENGIGIKGVLVRHLILPGGIAGTRESLAWLSEEVSPEVGLSLMSQYHPSNWAKRYAEINRSIVKEEYTAALRTAKEYGFKQTFVQGLSSPQAYLPDFNLDKPFGD